MGLFENQGACVKTPAKCIIYYGNRLVCINVESGDDLEKILCKIEKKFKSIFNTFSIQDLDYMHLVGDKECPPKSFKELIQLMLNNISISTNTEIVQTLSIEELPVSSCFIAELGETASIEDYITAIGNKVCSHVSQIQILTEGLAQANELISGLQGQIDQIIGG